MSSTALITGLYRLYLKREPDQGGLNYWVSVLDSGAASFDDVATTFANSEEARAVYQTLIDQVTALYRTILNREPDEAGLNYWVSVLNSNAASLADIAATFEATDEAQSVRAQKAAISAQSGSKGVIRLQTEAELEAQAALIQDNRTAVLNTGAVQSGQDFLTTQAAIEQNAVAQQQILQQAQASLTRQSSAAAAAYAVEVRAIVDNLYRQILKRAGDSGGLDYWTGLVVAGEVDESYIATAMSQSSEAIIVGAYEQYLYRVPGLEERQYWVGAIENQQLPVNQAISYIANSEEAQSYHETIVPTTGASELIVQTMNPATQAVETVQPTTGTASWATSYTNQDMIAADPVASPVVELQNYYAPDVNISSLEAVSPLGDTSPALAFKARDEIYKAYTGVLKREPNEADYQYWEPLLVNKKLSLDDFKQYVATSEEAKALAARSQAVSLTTTPPPEVIADAEKKTEGIGAAVGLLSAIAFFLGQ